MWQDLTTVFQKYMGTGMIFVWFCIALIYLFFKESNRERRIMFLYVPVIILIILFQPLFFRVFFRFLGSEIYFRFCWLLPVSVVIAASVVQFSSEFEGRKQRLVVALSVLVIMVCGKLVYSNPLYTWAENAYHVPQAVVRLCDRIHLEGAEVRAAFPQEFLLYVRQYDPTILMPFGREWNDAEVNDFVALLLGDSLEAEKLAEYMNQFYCQYVIMDAKKEILGEPRDFDLTMIDTIDGYAIYQNLAIPLPR